MTNINQIYRAMRMGMNFKKAIVLSIAFIHGVFSAYAATPKLLLDFQFNEGQGITSTSSVGSTVLTENKAVKTGIFSVESVSILLFDDFSSPEISLKNWILDTKGFEYSKYPNADGIFDRYSAYEGSGIRMDFTATGEYWSGRAYITTEGFKASKNNQLVLEVSRKMFDYSSGSTGARSSVIICNGDYSKWIHIDQCMDDGGVDFGWGWNKQTSSSNDKGDGVVNSLAYLGRGLALVKFVVDGENVQIYIDDVLYEILDFPVKEDIHFGFGVYSRAIGDHVSSVFNHVKVVNVEDVVSNPPEITYQTSDQIVKIGDSVTFEVSAIGTDPLSYQWYKDNVAIYNATDSSYTINNAMSTDAGSYTVIVSNSIGSISSEKIILTVNDDFIPPPTEGLEYSYNFDGTATIIGIGEASDITELVIPETTEQGGIVYTVTGIGNLAFYMCTDINSIIISNSITSIGVQAFFGCSKLKSVTIPASVDFIGDRAFEGCSRLTKVYFEGDAPRIDGVMAFYAPSTIYYRFGTKGWYSPWSGRPTTLWIEVPQIIDQPQNQTVENGNSVTFMVNAEGTSPLCYQWYKNGTAINGAVEKTYSIEYVKGSDVGVYTVIVSNKSGETESSPALLSLVQPYRATAELQIVNGFIVGITVIDCGWGYEFEPKVRIKDELGEGAEAHCIVENGMVTTIILDNTGSGYSEEATIKVGSPFRYNSMEIAVKDVLITMHLTFGEMYQLECSKDMKTWKKVGEPFIAEDETVEIVVDVIETGRYFRVHEVK